MTQPKQSPASIFVLVVAITAFSWLYMQWTHELGHIIVGKLTGAQLDRVILDPRSFSMTQFVSTPEPLMTAWGGPILGVLIGAGLPLVLVRLIRTARFHLYLIAAFVLAANGLYIGLGAFYPVGDAHGMLMFGSSRLELVLFGVISVVCARVMLKRSWEARATCRKSLVDAVLLLAACAMATTGVVLDNVVVTGVAPSPGTLAGFAALGLVSTRRRRG